MTTTEQRLSAEQKKLLDRMGRDAENYYQALHTRIRADFQRSLNQSLQNDVQDFRRSVLAILADAGLDAILPTVTQSLGGGVLGQIASGALEAAVGGTISGTLSTQSVATNAARTVFNPSRQSSNSPNLSETQQLSRLSQLQQHAERNR